MKDKELLNYIYENAKMGYESTLTLYNTLKNCENKILDAIKDILKGYQDFLEKSEKMIPNDEKKNPSIMVTLSADLGIKMKMMSDNSDSKVADMLIRGLTMGELEMTKKIDNFDKNGSKDIKKLAKEFKDFQSNSIVKLKKFL